MTEEWRAVPSHPTYMVTAVHVLVAEAFIGPRLPDTEIRHLDGDPGNNRLENLAYGTALENAADRERHGRTRRGDTSPTARISDKAVAEIRVLYAKRAANQYELAERFGISQAQVNNIVLFKQRLQRSSGG